MINPDDIESMSVLSVQPLPPLYGSQALQRCYSLLLQRKVTQTTSRHLQQPDSVLPRNGYPGSQNTLRSSSGEFASWGEKLNTPSDYDPVDFFQTGYNETNAVTVPYG